MQSRWRMTRPFSSKVAAHCHPVIIQGRNPRTVPRTALAELRPDTKRKTHISVSREFLKTVALKKKKKKPGGENLMKHADLKASTQN